VTLVLLAVVVSAGFITGLVISEVIGQSLEAELINSGRALTVALGESLANALLDGNLPSVQEALDELLAGNPDIVFAFAFGPGTRVVHTFPEGFPADLLHLAGAATPPSGNALKTDQGLVRHFGYRPFEGVSAALHLGVSQARIVAAQRAAREFVIGLTALGSLVAIILTLGLSRIALEPLAALARNVRRLGRGGSLERLDLPPGDEIGDLAQDFDQMATEVRGAIGALRASEAGYRDLLAAAGAAGEGIALIADEGPEEGTFLYVNEAFAALSGVDPEALVGMNAASLLHPAALPAARRSWDAIRRDHVAREHEELVLLDRAGHERALETSGALARYQGRRALAWFTRDVSDRRRREEEIRRRNRELMALNAVASAISEPAAADQVLDGALGQALAALDLETGWIFLGDETGGYHLMAVRGPAEGLEEGGFPACACGAVLETGQPMIVRIGANQEAGPATSRAGPDWHTSGTSPVLRRAINERCAASRVLAGHEPACCHASVPVQARGRRLGVLSVAAAGEHQFDDRELELLAAIGRQIGVALDNSRLVEELRDRERLRGELLQRAIRAQEEERQRIARELHDATGQSLSALVLGLSTLRSALEVSPARAGEIVDRLRISASDTVGELQSIIYDLRPALLDDLGLIPALRWYAQERLAPRGVEPALEVTGEPRRLPREVETALFRIGQEAITNAARHSGARRVELAVRFLPEHLELSVEDDGVGFDAPPALAGVANGRGLGLVGMRERARLLGGILLLESGPGKGTRLKVVLPLAEAQS
jgi:PAS domain S-box-containing protein